MNDRTSETLSTSVTEPESEKSKTLSTSVTEPESKKRKKNKGVVFAVFATVQYSNVDGYKIFNLDEAIHNPAGGGGGTYELVHPFITLKSCDYPGFMFFFSVGSKLYFCGGFDLRQTVLAPPRYTRQAYMLDVDSPQKNVISIPPMNFPKPNPLVFGPIYDLHGDDHKVYVFSCSTLQDRTFEMLSANTNQWKPLPVPTGIMIRDFTDRVSSALIGQNIFIYSSPNNYLYVFCTQTENWIRVRCTDYPYIFPFLRSESLFCRKENFHILLASLGVGDVPEVYTAPDFSLVGASSRRPLGTFQHSGQLENLPEHLTERPEFLGLWGILEGFFSLNDHSICFVRSRDKDREYYLPKKMVEALTRGFDLGENTRFFQDDHYVIDICDLSYILVDATTVKVQIDNSVTYRYSCRIPSEPKYLFAI